MTGFTEADIRAGASSQSFERGSGYYRGGAVSDVVRRGSLLTARVSGSDYAPYEIVVTLLDDGSIGAASCACPYNWGGYCKHIIAVLLMALREDAITVKPDLDTLLAGLTEAQLRRIIRAVAEDEPALVAAIEQEVEWLTQSATPVAAASATPVAHAITVDVAAIRREIRKDLRRACSRHMHASTSSCRCCTEYGRRWGEAADNLVGGPEHSILANDAFPVHEFDFMFSNPPYGKSWKSDLERVGGKDGIKDPHFVIEHPGGAEYSLLTRSSDGQLLFLANMPSKMKRDTPLGSRIAAVHNDTSLFTRDAGPGESNIRCWIIENDWQWMGAEQPR